jgi:hypothetical protein
MSEFFETFDNLIGSAKQHAASTAKKQRWKFCVALAASGYVAKKIERVKEPGTNDIMVTWSKAGKDDIEIRLSYSDQQMWIEYAQMKANNEQVK